MSKVLSLTDPELDYAIKLVTKDGPHEFGYDAFWVLDKLKTAKEAKSYPVINNGQFSVRTWNCLVTLFGPCGGMTYHERMEKLGERPLSDLCAYSAAELMQIRNMGKTSVGNVREVLRQHSLHLKGEPIDK